MRLILAAALFAGSTAYAHDNLEVEQRTGLKSEAVILNDMRLRGVKVSDVHVKGLEAEVSATLQGQEIRLKVDRMTGALEQIGGSVRLEPRLLKHGIMRVPD